MKYELILLVMIFLMIVPLMAITDEAGTSGFAFLKMKYSARAAALANAYTGMTNEVDGVFYNPAGLAEIKSPRASVTYMSYIMDVHCGAAVYSFLRNNAVLSVFTKGLSASEERTLEGEYGNYAGTDGTFGVNSFIGGLSIARKVLDNLDVAINAKYLHETLDKQSASAIAFDLGILHQTTHENVKVGIVLKNFGKQLSYYTEEEYEEKLPRTVNVGFNYHPDEKLYVLVDAYKPLDNEFSARIGVEYQVHPIFSLRTGYKSNASDWKARGDNEWLSGFSFGLGLELTRYKMKLDYGLISYGDLGYVNLFTLGYGF